MLKYWTNVVVEGHCMADTGEEGKAPCGRGVPHPFCLGSGSHAGVCPHFGWSETTERNAALFVPLRFILNDRLGIWWRNVTSKVSWWLWGQLWFNQRKTREFFDNIEVLSDDDPIMIKMHEEDRKLQVKFEKWFPKAKKDW